MKHAPLTSPSPQPRPRTGLGLKLRLWLACLSGGLIAAAGTLWMLATPRLSPSDPAVYGFLAGIALASLVLGLLLALWIDHHVVGHLHGLLLGLRSSRVAELRGLPAGAGWGELSELGDAVQEVLERRNRELRAVRDLERLRDQLALLQSSIEQWQRTERWERPAVSDGGVSDVSDVLGHALARRGSIDEQNRDVAGQVASELSGVIADAHEAASQAERGFVEATALQTSVRELNRLAGELASALRPGGAAAPAGPAAEPAAERARQALEELVAAASESVESLGRGLLRVQDVSEQVQRLANRATLIAIQALTGGGAGAPATADPAAGPTAGPAAMAGHPATFAEEIKILAREVREATDRTQRFAQEIDAAVADADTRMRAAREQALARMAVPAEAVAAAPAQTPGASPGPDVRRLIERVLEMVQDAGAKSERVSTASERASSVAERLARRLEANSSDAEALVVRLAPVGETGATGSSASPDLQLVEDDEPHAPELGEPERKPRRGEERP